jgi:hypothetical protein
MLQPEDRAALYDALRPPAGHTLDHAIGTSFTLDLEALLTAPVAFALYGAADIDPSTSANDAEPLEPVGLLEAIRRNADQMTFFCQAGHIGVPRKHRHVFAWLEDAVIAVQAPRNGFLFHPKVWVVRYVANDRASAVLRVLCATRNLTFDTSWDTLLRVDSEPYLVESGPEPPANSAAANGEPLATFLRDLPALATSALTAERSAALASIAGDVERAHFEAPDPFTSLQFNVFGWPGAVDPFADPADRMAIVSPFVDNQLLGRLLAGTEITALVTRQETVAKLDSALLAQVGRVAVLNPAADIAPEIDGSTTSDGVANRDGSGAAPLHGSLHAKLFVSDTGQGARVLTGSANATSAAFGGNIEVVVEMDGPQNCGVGALLATGEKGTSTFGSLLVDCDTATIEDEVTDTDADRLTRSLDRHLRHVAELTYSATVRELGDDYGLRLQTVEAVPPLEDAVEATIHVRPVTLDEGQASRPVSTGQVMDVDFLVSLEGLSAFFVITIEGRLGAERTTASSLVKVPLTGAPDDRRSRILAAMLRDPDRLLRYMLLLLADDSAGDATGDGTGEGSWRAGLTGHGWDDLPLVEVLVRAVDRYPDRLDHIDALLRDLADQRSGVLPAGFDDLWSAIWNARSAAR